MAKATPYKDYLYFQGEEECPPCFEGEERGHWMSEARHYECVQRGDTKRFKQLYRLFRKDNPEDYPKDYSQTNKEIVAWMCNEILTFSGNPNKAIQSYRRRFCLLRYCLYYKGEKECPFEYGSTEGCFWEFERMYLDNPQIHTDYETHAKRYIETHKTENNFMTSKAPLYQKGFVLYAEAMLEKWMPDSVNMVFQYGPKIRKQSQWQSQLQ